jgi:CheY-like chemotaxis protein
MPTVMIVDDEKDVVELISFLLKKDGYEIITAANGREALEKLGLPVTEAALPLETGLKPHLMILDIMMPEIDGYTVQNKMMENERTRTIPIVILTAKGHMRDLFGMATNVAAYIEKPFDPRTLRAQIKELLNNHEPA